MSEPATKSGTFLVTVADGDTGVLSAVADGQVCPLAANPGFAEGEVVEATLAAEGPLGVTWRPVEVAARWTPEIVALEEPPGARARGLVEGASPGRLVRDAIDGGERHVLVVPPAHTDAAVADVLADETTRRVAARLGARRVEVRGGDGIVDVRYLE